MASAKKNAKVLITSLLLTIIIFGIGMTLNYSLDFFRINSIVRIMNEHEIDSGAYIIQSEFISEFGGDECKAMRSRVEDLKNEMKKVGDELSAYGRLSFFKKNDFDYLKRKHSLLELRFFTIINKLNEQCEQPYTTILFFFETDHDISERQGYILSDINLQYPQEIIVLSFDKNYDEPLVRLMVERYNITKAPTIVIDGEVKLEGLHYEEELREIIDGMILEHRMGKSDYDPSYVLNAVGMDTEEFAENIELMAEEEISPFAKGDAYLTLGRLRKNKTIMCRSLEYYENAEPQSPEEEAILLETIASLGCGADRKGLLLEAADVWESLGVEFRAEIDMQLAKNQKPAIEFDTSGPYFSPSPAGASKIIIGGSSITLSNEDILVSQADRVTRDWLSYQVFSSPYSESLLTTFSERLTYTKSELLPSIGWHEGARIKEIVQNTGLKHMVASGTIAARKDGRWYAPDEEGVFRFEVPRDKILYPTTRFLSEDIAVIIDTHGINSIVEQAVRYNASVVVGCCDHTAKIKAAEYLAKKGIKVICLTDKYLPLLLGKSLPVLGSPPIEFSDGKAVLGNRPITIDASEIIVAEDLAENSTAQSYYDTPARYFRNLGMMAAGLDIVYAPVKRTGEMQTVIDAAESVGAGVIGARVFNSEDYDALKEWLLQDTSRRAVLFHSVSYPYGYKIFREFPEQTSFDDISPVFK